MSKEDRCKHEFLWQECAICKIRSDGIPQIVYTSVGGDVFHKRPNCEAFKSGQNMAYAVGNLNHEIKPTNRSYVDHLGRCEWCFSSLDPKINKPCKIYYSSQWINATLINTRFIGHGNLEYLVIFKNSRDDLEETVVRKSMIRFSSS
jgi:hypothetical protein